MSERFIALVMVMGVRVRRFVMVSGNCQRGYNRWGWQQKWGHTVQHATIFVTAVISDRVIQKEALGRTKEPHVTKSCAPAPCNVQEKYIR